MYNLTLERVKELAAEYNIIPLVSEFYGDMDTPISVFKRMADKGESFLLESMGSSLVTSRYSFIGRNPFIIFLGKGNSSETIYSDGRKETATGNPIENLEKLGKPLPRTAA